MKVAETSSIVSTAAMITETPKKFVADGSIASTGRVGTMIARIIEGMAQNAADRALRQAEKKVMTKFFPINPEQARREFQLLVETGYDDITVGFWRVSDTQQTADDTWGPETQMKSVTAYAAAFTDRGVDIWIHDIESGQHETRIGVDLVREFAATGKVANVISYRYDRLARSQYLSEMVEHDFKKSRTQWVSATENLPGGPLGKLMKQILVALAQYEVAVIVQRMSGGKKMAVQKKGVYAGGEPPYGYLPKGRRGNSGKGILVICEIEAQIVLLVFRLYEMGFGQSAIANFLNRQGIPTRKGGSLAWKQAQIRRILRQEAAYRAEELFGDLPTEGPIAHEAILPTRPVGERNYLFGSVNGFPHGTQVPDDLEGAPIPILPRMNSVHNMTQDQAKTLLRLFAIRDQGNTQAKCAEILSSMGMTTLEGRPFTHRTVQMYLVRRTMYQATIDLMGVTLADEDIAAEMQPIQHYDQQSIEMEMVAIERIKALRIENMSYAKIAAQLAAEGRKTRMGGLWYPSQVQRVLKGGVRRAEAFGSRGQ